MPWQTTVCSLFLDNTQPTCIISSESVQPYSQIYSTSTPKVSVQLISSVDGITIFTLDVCDCRYLVTLFLYAKIRKNQFSVNDCLGGIRFWPATWDAITVSYIFLALQNCMRYIYRQKNESRLSGPPVHRIPVPAFHGKVHLRSNLYAQHKSCGQHEPTQQCCFHQMKHSAPLE